METIDIKYCDIPEFLHNGEFYRSLSTDDPEETIGIPADCFLLDGDAVDNIDQLCQLLRVTMFWMLDEIPIGIISFCYRNEVDVWQHVMMSVPGAEESSLLKPLLSAYRSNQIQLKEIISLGRWELIVHAVKVMGTDGPCTIAAAEVGDLRVLKFLHEHGFDWHSETCSQASSNGHLDCLQYAHENGCPWDYCVYTMASRNGHLHIMQYAHQQGLQWHLSVCSVAAQYGHLVCLQYAHENGCPFDQGSVAAAAEHGQLLCLQYLLEQGCPIHEQACTLSCISGNLDCLQLLHDHDAPWNEETCACAALCIDVACLQYLHENGCPWNESVPATAAAAGSISCLEYTMEHHCPYSRSLPQCAVLGGLECFRYLLVEWALFMDGAVFLTALLKGDLECLQYAIDQDCPYYEVKFEADTKAYDRIFVRNNPKFVLCVQFAVERGWKINHSFCKYVSSRDEACVDYLKKEELFIEGGWDDQYVENVGTDSGKFEQSGRYAYDCLLSGVPFRDHDVLFNSNKC